MKIQILYMLLIFLKKHWVINLLHGEFKKVWYD